MTTKLCKTCKKEKNLTQFNKKSSCKDGLQKNCRECCNEQTRSHYKNNKQYYSTRNKKNKKEVRVQYIEYLKKCQCSVCGENHPATLDFDHIDPKTKKLAISKMVGNFPWSTVLKEIKKCQVLCSNCHRKRTALQFEWYK